VRATPGPPLPLSPPTLLSLPRKNFPSAQTRVLAALVRGFSISLLSPPFLLRFGAFVLSVCDSFDYPSRILISGVFLEYFAAVGDKLSELECLIYAYISCFDACLVLLQVPIVFPFILIVVKSFFMSFVKNFRKGRWIIIPLEKSLREKNQAQQGLEDPFLNLGHLIMRILWHQALVIMIMERQMSPLSHVLVSCKMQGFMKISCSL
jgi:hypothetical protein